MAKEYVLGFAFSHDRKDIILIQKQKPEWQKGKYNGVGGKIEESDSCPLEAMIREFLEETGVDTSPEDWSLYATMTFNDDIMGGKAIVHCFRMFSNFIYGCKSMEIEQIRNISVEDELHLYPVIDNLPILIPMALHEGITYCSLTY